MRSSKPGTPTSSCCPVDRVPSLAQGYWNLFVGGFPDSDAAKAYCEQNGLSVPDQCFAVYADPNAPAGG